MSSLTVFLFWNVIQSFPVFLKYLRLSFYFDMSFSLSVLLFWCMAVSSRFYFDNFPLKKDILIILFSIKLLFWQAAWCLWCSYTNVLTAALLMMHRCVSCRLWTRHLCCDSTWTLTCWTLLPSWSWSTWTLCWEKDTSTLGLRYDDVTTKWWVCVAEGKSETAVKHKQDEREHVWQIDTSSTDLRSAVRNGLVNPDSDLRTAFRGNITRLKLTSDLPV